MPGCFATARSAVQRCQLPLPRKDDFILHILAKVSPQYPEARALLIEQARSDRIPASTWPSIASALAGVQFNFGTQFFDPVSPGGTGGTTYHLEANQNFNRSPVTANWSAADFNQHLDLINQLLAVTANAAAVGVVGFTLRAQSLKQFHLGPGPLQYQADSLTTRVALRR